MLDCKELNLIGGAQQVLFVKLFSRSSDGWLAHAQRANRVMSELDQHDAAVRRVGQLASIDFQSSLTSMPTISVRGTMI